MKTIEKKNEPVMDVCDMLFSKIERPKNFKRCIASNVGGNKYRINIYNSHYDESDLEFQTIQSYICKVDGNELLFGKHKRTSPGIHGVTMEWLPQPPV
jgi:hypothetical protein